MKTKLQSIISELKDVYGGEPWYGRPARALLQEVDEASALERLYGHHSILELLWHMITWREFTINCLQPSSDLSLKYFEELDWRELDHHNPSLWKEGLKKLEKTQTALIHLLQQQDDTLLEQNVRERTYDYQKLLTGIIQHDIYHLGQIAFITKAVHSINKE